MRKEVIGQATLYLGDCREVLPGIAVDSIVTSPPYGLGKDYERGGRLEWLADMAGFFAAVEASCVVLNIGDIRTHADPLLPRVQADVQSRKGTVTAQDIIDAAKAGKGSTKAEIAAALGCSEQTIDRRLLGNNARGGKYEPQSRIFLTGAALADLAAIAGYYLHDTRLWVKDPCWQSCQYHSGSDRAVDEYEHVMVFRPAGGVPVIERSRLQRDEWAAWGSRAVWPIPSVRANNDHPAKFPLELARRMVALWGGDVTCDPFMGSGTAGEACAALGKSFVGIERDPNYFDLACRRIERAHQLEAA